MPVSAEDAAQTPPRVLDSTLRGGRRLRMIELWADIDQAVLACVSEGTAGPGDIGRRLGMSEAAATSILMMLAVEGKVRVCRVALPDSAP
jgi:hypothetical protein